MVTTVLDKQFPETFPCLHAHCYIRRCNPCAALSRYAGPATTLRDARTSSYRSDLKREPAPLRAGALTWARSDIVSKVSFERVRVSNLHHAPRSARATSDLQAGGTFSPIGAHATPARLMQAKQDEGLTWLRMCYFRSGRRKLND